MSTDHKEDMLKAASDGALWNLWFTNVPDKNNIDRYVSTALDQFEKDLALPFVVIDRTSSKVIGTTRFLNSDSRNRRIEIGSTWYSKSYQRTGVNTECKYLLLQYAFEVLNCIAVEFRTHWHNHPSRNALIRLGTKQDGVLRNHRIGSDGTIRDTVVFSILDTEWNTVKKSLLHKMSEV